MNVAGGVLVSLLLLFWRHWIPPVLAICFGGATLAAFTMATTVGLFGDHEIWQGRYVFIAAAVELLVFIAVSAMVLMFADEDPAPQTRPRGKHSTAQRCTDADPIDRSGIGPARAR